MNLWYSSTYRIKTTRYINVNHAEATVPKLVEWTLKLVLYGKALVLYIGFGALEKGFGPTQSLWYFTKGEKTYKNSLVLYKKALVLHI